MLDYEVPPPEDCPCPRCGVDATWHYTDAHQSRVELHCPDCGNYILLRSEFDTLLAERLTQDSHEP